MDPSFVFVFTCDHILPKKVGPVLGALLYKAAGFCLPFALTGTAILLSGFQVLVVTKMPSMASNNSSTSPQSSSSLAILSKPTVLIGLATATAGAYSIGTVEATVLFFYNFQNLKIFSHPGNPLPLPLHQPGLADHQDRPGLPRHVPLLRPCHPFLWMAV